MRIGITASQDQFKTRLESALEPTMRLVPCTPDDLTTPGRRLDVVVIGGDLPIDEALQTARQLEETYPTAGVVIVAEPDPELFRAALLSGARDLWSPDIANADMVTSLRRVVESCERRRTAEHAVSPRAAGSAQVIVVLSPKGGAGKTTIATNLAQGIARTSDRSVALVDLDLQFGDVATALDLEPEYSVADAVHNVSNVAHLKSMLAAGPAGMHVLCAPDDPAACDKLDPDSVALVIEVLSSQLDTIVVDTGAGLDEFTLAVLDLATDLVIVSTTDIFAIRGTRKLLDVLELIDFGEPDRHLILNRANARVDISRSEIEDMLTWNVDVEIPSTRAVPLAMNRGESLLDVGKVVRRPIEQLLGRFVDATRTNGAP